MAYADNINIKIMWKVVIFEEDNSLPAVPEFWYRNGICW